MGEERSIYYVLTTYDKCKPIELIRAGDIPDIMNTMRAKGQSGLNI